jgi:uncharacterized protein YbjT (DUF2867 family)
MFGVQPATGRLLSDTDDVARQLLTESLLLAGIGGMAALAVSYGGSLRLLAAEKAVGISHHLCVSIVGCDRAPVGYYGVKFAQERAVEEGTVPWSILRSTQFHEFVAKLFASAARWSVLPVPRARVQTVAIAETAQAIADICERPPCLGRIHIAGPEICTARELALAWRAFSGRHAMLIEIPLPGKLGRALREGALTTDRPDIRGKLGFRDWLAQPGVSQTGRSNPHRIELKDSDGICVANGSFGPGHETHILEGPGRFGYVGSKHEADVYGLLPVR